MKKALCLLMFTCFLFQFSITNAQIGNLKNKVSNASKEAVKPKDSKKPAETKEEKNTTETKMLYFENL